MLSEKKLANKVVSCETMCWRNLLRKIVSEKNLQKTRFWGKNVLTERNLLGNMLSEKNLQKTRFWGKIC